MILIRETYFCIVEPPKPMLLTTIPQTVVAQWEIKRISRVHGGDINQCFCLEGKRNYFLKMNDAKNFPLLFDAEADGLHGLKSSSLIVPDVLAVGEEKGRQYLLLTWLDGGMSVDFWRTFGKKLAQLHALPQSFFGWHRRNYIGSLVQENTKSKLWSDFYERYRIMPLVKRLFERGDFSQRNRRQAENYCRELPSIFPTEPPSLLHGDLWNGNFKATPQGAAIFDPAVYCGHREMDLGMTKLFGGFDPAFYESYEQEYPLEKNWRRRLPHTQLYPVLVHAVLFGGHYVEKVKQFLKGY